MLLGVALIVAGAAVLYFAVTGNDPRDLISPSGGLRLAPKVGPTGPMGPVGPAPAGGTAGVLAALALMRTYVATRHPGSTLVVISVYRPGAIVAGTQEASEHAFANAADVRILKPGGALNRPAMDGLYALLLATPHCELCWNGRGGCTTGHTDHLHYAPSPCHA